MPAFKFTLLFQLSTNVDFPGAAIHRIGGWSESWYSTLANATAVLNYARTGGTGGQPPPMLYSRAALLPNGASIVGYRIQQVDPAAGAQTGFLTLPGDKAQAADVPQMALLYSVPSLGKTNVRRCTIRGLPDAVVTEGETNFGQAYQASLLTYFNSLSGWSFRGRDLSQSPVKILTISSVGVVQTETPHGLAVNQMVRILRTSISATNQVGGRFQVSTLGPGSNTFTLLNWPYSATTGGIVRPDAIIYPGVDAVNIQQSRIVVRKVGRPFTQFRGRKSKRKR